MIEFKGECGHLIRARDEDAGKVVRCTYCGRESLVAPPPDGEIAGLLDQMERTGAFDSKATKAHRRAHKVQQRDAARQSGAVDPFEVIRKMIYVAVAIIVCYIAWVYAGEVLRKLPGARDRGRETTHVETQTAPTPPGEENTSARRGNGLIATRLDPAQSGVYVTSVPRDADVYAVSEWDGKSPIMSTPSASLHVKTNTAQRFNAGKQFIAVAVRINNTELMKDPAYTDLRRKIERDASFDNDVLTDYFLPDGSRTTRVEEHRSLLYIVRIFEAQVAQTGWQQVTALFLPRMPLEDLLTRLPAGDRYAFDAAGVQGELNYYGVPRNDHQSIMEALRRIGMIVYARDEESPYWCFRIDLEEGFLVSDKLGY